MTIPFLKPSDLKPAPADGKLVRDTNALEWLGKAEFLASEAKRSFQQNKTTSSRALILAATTALGRAIGAPTNNAAISDIFIATVRAEEAADTDTVRTDALKTLRDLMTDEYVPHAIRADIAKYVIESRIG